MNHKIKAKNKTTGEVVDVTVIDKGRYNEYIYITTDYTVSNTGEYKTTGETEHINSEEQFNDLFEVVEDKFKVGDKVKFRIGRGPYLTDYVFTIYESVKNTSTDRTYYHISNETHKVMFVYEKELENLYFFGFS